MTITRVAAAALIAIATFAGPPLRAQVGKGIADLNQLKEADLAALPGLTPAIAKAFVDKRPFTSITDANAFLLGQKLTQDQLNTIYGKAFVHVNLNTATRDEILLIPGAGRRMTIEFPEYRPWKTWAQFDREIGKYVGQAETDRLKQYVFIPIDLNTASDDVIMTIPGMTAGMLREFKEYRPWKTEAQFQREIGKYVDAKEVARLWRFVTIPAQP
jgi:DNA uptake protein ComE-like DNA-binding protein